MAHLVGAARFYPCLLWSCRHFFSHPTYALGDSLAMLALSLTAVFPTSCAHTLVVSRCDLSPCKNVLQAKRGQLNRDIILLLHFRHIRIFMQPPLLSETQRGILFPCGCPCRSFQNNLDYKMRVARSRHCMKSIADAIALCIRSA